MQNWKELYLELGEILAEIEGIKWVDLWHNQITFLEDEHAFPSPAIFLAFRTVVTEDGQEKIQAVRLQVEAYLFYETFADTYKDSVNQGTALSFLDNLTSIHAKLHGQSGEHFSEMRRTGFSPVDTGGAGNLYLVTFECNLVDQSATVPYEEAAPLELTVETGDNEPEPEPEHPEDLPVFFIPG